MNFKPNLESLESRECPAIVPTLSGGVLSVQGTDNFDWVIVKDSGDQVQVNAYTYQGGWQSNGSYFFARSQVARLNIDGGAGYSDHLENQSSVPADMETRVSGAYLYNRASNSVLTSYGDGGYLISSGGHDNSVTSYGSGTNVYVTNENHDVVGIPNHNAYDVQITGTNFSQINLGVVVGHGWERITGSWNTITSAGGDDLCDVVGDHNLIRTGQDASSTYNGAWVVDGSYNEFHAGTGHLHLEIAGLTPVQRDPSVYGMMGYDVPGDTYSQIYLEGGSCIVTCSGGGESTFFGGSGSNTIHLNGTGENTVYLGMGDVVDGLTATDELHS